MRKNVVIIIILALTIGLLVASRAWWRQKVGLINTKNSFQKQVANFENQIDQLQQLVNDKKSEDIIYFVNNNDSQPLFFNGILFPLNDLRKNEKGVDAKDLSLTPIIKVPQNSSISGVVRHNDMIVFTIHTSIVFKNQIETGKTGYKNSYGYSRDLLTTYRYQIDTQEIDPLFTNFDFDLSGKYAVVNAISEDGLYASFKVSYCLACDGLLREIFIYSIKERVGKIVGDFKLFELLNDGKYRYKEIVYVPSCNTEGPGECEKYPEDLPYRYGSFNLK